MRANAVHTAAKVIESAGICPPFCAIARRAELASTSVCQPVIDVARGLDVLHITRKPWEVQSSGWSALCRRSIHGTKEELKKCLKPLSGLGSQPQTQKTLALSVRELRPRKGISHLHDHQQCRGAFGLPNLSEDTTKKYQERRLIGCAFSDGRLQYLPCM
jgi:hypothetical protein